MGLVFGELQRNAADDVPAEWRLVATHLQGDERDVARSAQVRRRQIDQIESELIAPNADPHVPLFIAGDFCLPRWDGPLDAPESPAYRQMLEVLMAQNGPERRITLDDSARNDLATDHGGRAAELDYILMRPNGHAVDGRWQRHVFRKQWSSDPPRSDLSYRYAVTATFDWK